MPSLTVADLRGSRLHLFWVRVAVSVAMVAMIVFDITTDVPQSFGVPDRAPLGTFDYYATSLQIAMLGLVAVIWFAPRLTLLWLVPVGWLVPVSGVELPTLWRGLAVASLLVLAWMMGRSGRARSHGLPQRPVLEGAFEDSVAFRRAWPGWAVVAGFLVVAAGLLFVHHAMMVKTMDFEARAVDEVATVISYDDNYEMQLRIGAQQLTVDDPLWDERPDVGTRLPVLVDPQDAQHIVFVSSLEDPSWLVGLALVVPILGLRWGLPIILRAHRRRTLTVEGAPGVHVTLIRNADGDYRVLPVGSAAPFLNVVNIDGVIPFDGDETNDEDDGIEEEEEDSIPETDADLAAWADGFKREIDDWEDALGDDDSSELDPEEKAWMEAHVGPEVEDGEGFFMLGAWSHGSTVALLRGSGALWLAELREPRFGGGAYASQHQRAEKRSKRHRTWDGPAWERFGAVLSLWSEQNFGWLRWVVAMGVAVISVALVPLLVDWGFSDGWDGFDWVRTVVLAVGLLPWPIIALDLLPSRQVHRAAHGIARYGWVLDDVLARDRVTSVVAGDDAVGLRMQDPEDALMVVPQDVGQDLTPVQAAELIRRWLSSAPAQARSGNRPSPGLIGVMVILGGWALLILPKLR